MLSAGALEPAGRGAQPTGAAQRGHHAGLLLGNAVALPNNRAGWLAGRAGAGWAVPALALPTTAADSMLVAPLVVAQPSSVPVHVDAVPVATAPPAPSPPAPPPSPTARPVVRARGNIADAERELAEAERTVKRAALRVKALEATSTCVKTTLAHKLSKGVDGVEPLVEIAKTFHKALDLSKRAHVAATEDVAQAHKRLRDETAAGIEALTEDEVVDLFADVLENAATTATAVAATATKARDEAEAHAAHARTWAREGRAWQRKHALDGAIAAYDACRAEASASGEAGAR